MDFIEQLTAVALLTGFFLGVTFGVVGAAAYGSRLEDREYSLRDAAPDAVSGGARTIYGLYTRGDRSMASRLCRGRVMPGISGDGRRGSDSGARGKDPER